MEAASRRANVKHAEARITQGRAYTQRSLNTLKRAGVDTSKLLSDAPRAKPPLPSPDPAPDSGSVRVHRPFHPTPDVQDKTQVLRQRTQDLARRQAKQLVGRTKGPRKPSPDSYAG